MSKETKYLAVTVLLGLLLILALSVDGRHRDQVQTVRIGLAVYNAKDAYISKITGYLDQEIYQYEQEHPEVKIRRDLADAGGSQQEQNRQIDRYISLGYDLLLVNIVDRTNASVIIDKASEEGIPVVFFNREPVKEDIFRSEEVYYEGSDAKMSALLQADVIADAYEKDPKSLDRNEDGIIAYAMLEGESGHQDTLIRSEWVLKGLETRGIRAEKVVSTTANWERSQASAIVTQWEEAYGDSIELIISNNDDMAIGAAEALEELHRDDIQVVGIDGVEEMVEMVQEGRVLGTVLCDTRLHAQALFQFIEAIAIDPGKKSELLLQNDRYYMIPLSKLTADEEG